MSITNWLYNYRKELYAKKMFYYKSRAEYNLYRHGEAVENYSQKKSKRSSSFTTLHNEAMGYYIADENADLYAEAYNANWLLYIKYKHKWEMLVYENTGISSNAEVKDLI